MITRQNFMLRILYLPPSAASKHTRYMPLYYESMSYQSYITDLSIKTFSAPLYKNNEIYCFTLFFCFLI